MNVCETLYLADLSQLRWGLQGKQKDFLKYIWDWIQQQEVVLKTGIANKSNEDANQKWMPFCNSLITNLSLRYRIRNLDFFPVEMPTGLEIIFLILSIAEFIIGMLGNVFIGLVNCSEWVKNQNISLADFIFTCLAISRISQLLVLLVESLIIGLPLYLFSTHKLAKPITLLWRITNHLTTWLATCLSIFYLLKIAHFSHSLFLWLKWRMNRVILVIFVFSFIFLIFDFLLLEGFNDLFLHVYMQDYSNLTLYMEESKTLYFETLILLSLTCLLPIVLSLTSLLLLFLSLVRHIRNLQLNSMGSRDSSTEAHKRAIKMVMSFLFLFILYFFSTQVVNWIFLMFPSHVIIKFISLLVYVFPSSHSFLLILGNSKLRQTALKVLWHLKSSLRRENLLYLYRHISQSLFKDNNLTRKLWGSIFTSTVVFSAGFL